MIPKAIVLCGRSCGRFLATGAKRGAARRSRLAVMSDHTEVWNVSAADFPEEATPGRQWRFLLNYAVMAPSNRNSQPWLFRVHDEELELYADRSRACRISDPRDRELTISCGAALFNLRAAMRHFGRLGGVRLLPDDDHPDLLARVRFGDRAEATKEEMELFQAIPERRTFRRLFQDDPVSEESLMKLRHAAESEGAWIQVVTENDGKAGLADLIAEADQIQWSDKRFRLEFAVWVRRAPGAFDGLPEYAQGQTDLLSFTGPMAVRTFELADGQAAFDHDLAAYSPALLVLGAQGDDPVDWMRVGQALEHVLLRAEASGLCVSYLNQPIEVEETRPRVAEALGREGFPHLVLRVGYGESVRPTPRRGVAKVLV